MNVASLPSFCQKLSKLVEIWQSSDKNKFAQFLLRHGVNWSASNGQIPKNRKANMIIIRHKKANYSLMRQTAALCGQLASASVLEILLQTLMISLSDDLVPSTIQLAGNITQENN